jgi:hypothetical protein
MRFVEDPQLPGKRFMNLKSSFLSIPVLLSALMMVGCAERSRSWTEEVRLDDGSVVHVKRKHRYERMGPISGPPAAIPLEGRLRVIDDNGTSPEWTGLFDPILLYRDPRTHDYVLVCSTNALEVWQQNGKHDPPYWEFRLQGKVWKPEELDPSLFGKPTNLLLSAAWVDSTWGLVTFAKKEKWTNEYGHGLIASYATINPNSRFGIN